MKVIFNDNSVLKKVLELFKDVVTSANFKCRPDGIFMQAMDTSHISMASFNFALDMFSKYECPQAIDIGIDFTHMTTILKVIEKDDLLGMELLNGDKLSLQVKNPKTKKEWCFDLKLMDIESEELEIPPSPSGWYVNMDSTEFSKNIGTIANFSDVIHIGCTDGKLLFKADGDMANAMLSTETDCKWVGEESEKQNVILNFTSKLLSKYSSGKTLSKNIEIVLAPDHPIMIRYLLTSNSFVQFFIAPKIED